MNYALPFYPAGGLRLPRSESGAGARRMLCALLLSILAPAALAGALDDVRQRGVLEVAVYESFPPFSHEQDGRPAGIEVDIARALAEHMGLDLKLRVIAADESMSDDLRNNIWKGHYMGGGVADAMLHAPFDPQYAQVQEDVHFIAPYYREPVVLAVDPEYAGIPLAALLREHKIGVGYLTQAESYLLSFGGPYQDHVANYRSAVHAAKALKEGEVAAVMGHRSEIQAGLGEAKSRYPMGPVHLPGFWRSGFDYGVAVKAGEDHAALAEAIQQAMAELRSSGAIERIFEEHGISYQAPSLLRLSNNVTL